MISRIAIGRLLIAMLAVAQLGTSLHAAEHGHGDHDHDDGVECVFVAVTNDDGDAPLPSDETPQSFSRASGAEPIPAGTISARSTLHVPPATGPPATA